ncbi:MATE family efflux transporter [Flaviaesturariibacter terrae]
MDTPPASGPTRHLLEGPIAPVLLRLAVPIVLANVLQAAYQLIDAFWVGRIGGAAVAAVSVSTPVSFLLIALGAGLAIAGSTLIAQYAGAGNAAMVNHVAAQTLLMVLLVSALLGGIGFAGAPYLLRLMGVAPDVYDGALGFMRVSFAGLAFNFTFFVFQSFMRGVGRPGLPVWIVLGTVVLNFALDPPLIFGWGPIPALGVMGAAVATFITQTLAALIGIAILFRGKQGIHLRWRDFRPEWSYIRRAFALGFPASIEQSMRALGIMMMTFLLASFGTLAMAAYGVGSNVLQLVMIPAMGLSMAISTLVGQNIGAGRVERAAQAARLGAKMGFIGMTVFGVLVFLLARSFATFFVPEDQNVIREASVFLRTMAPAWGFLGLQLCISGVFRASGNMIIPMLLTMASQWVLQFPLAYVLSKHSTLGLHGLWYAFPAANVVIALVSLAVFARGSWKNKRLTNGDAELERRVVNEIYAEEGGR